MNSKKKQIPLAIGGLIVKDWIGEKNEKLSMGNLSKKYSIAKLTVQSIISNYRKTRKLENLTGPGRKTIFNNRQERQILKKD